jgi:hypothetical protein
MSTPSHDKIEAIYDLREAAAQKARLEIVVDERPSPGARAALLDATLDVEAKTQHAIEVCHECGHRHASDRAHVERGENVIQVDFGGAGDGAGS